METNTNTIESASEMTKDLVEIATLELRDLGQDATYEEKHQICNNLISDKISEDDRRMISDYLISMGGEDHERFVGYISAILVTYE